MYFAGSDHIEVDIQDSKLSVHLFAQLSHDNDIPKMLLFVLKNEQVNVIRSNSIRGLKPNGTESCAKRLCGRFPAHLAISTYLV